MGENSAIEWTGDTWNVVTGCTKLSPACANCYIERTPPFRVAGRKFVKGHIPLQFHEDRLSIPLRKQKPTTYFVNSLSDLFHEDVPDAFIDRVFAVMALSPQHTFQVLTKRAERMRDYLRDPARHHDVTMSMQGASAFGGVGDLIPANGRSYPRWPERWPLPNVWLGVSVENQHFADERIPLLLQTPAAIRFLSCEPLLGEITLKPRWLRCPECKGRGTHDCQNDRLVAVGEPGPCPWPETISWVISGGESGPRVRPTRIEWLQSLRDQCVAAGVPYFFKQWGGRTSKAGGRLLDGRTWDEMPEVPHAY